jgi:hypothetical protein
MAEVEQQQQQDVKLFNRWTFDDVQVREWLLSPAASIPSLLLLLLAVD